jgi:hypothetical protein
MRTDLGKEFFGKETSTYFSTQGIRHYSTGTYQGAALAEQFIRTLKAKLAKFFTENKSRKWLEILPSLLKSYNSQEHSAIGKSPDEITYQNQAALFQSKLLPFDKLKKPKFETGNKFRIAIEKPMFTKGYEITYSKDVYEISSVSYYGSIVTYRLAELSRRYYEHELILAFDN